MRPFLLLTAFIVSSLAGSVPAAGQVPGALSVQGLATVAGTPLSDGTYAVTVRVYDQEAGGTVLAEQAASVAVTDGHFAALIDPGTLPFDRPYWLGLTFTDVSSAELTPRTPLTAVPYSHRARLLDAAALVPGENVSIEADGDALRISATGSTTAGVTALRAGEGLEGNATTGAITLNLADEAVTGPKLADGTAVRSVNGLTEEVTLEAGENVTLTATGQTLTIDAAAGLTLPVDVTQEIDTAPAFRVTNTGTRSAAEFRVDNNDNFNSAILASTTGTGATIFARTFGLGRSALFRNEGFSNAVPAVETFTAGSGPALLANHGGFSGDVAVFQSSGTNVARIDKDGTGFFNGGVQSNGADVAELFAVEGLASAYEPGDVLVISTEADRTMAKSQAPYSTLVAGVTATKPGLILTERSLDEDTSDLVHLGVIGVIPTKVTAENGPIQRGDLLVTSSRPGHAMRGTDAARLPGAVLGKALEPFDGAGIGLIRVLVSAR